MPLLLWARKGRDQDRKVGVSTFIVLGNFKNMINRLQYLSELLEKSPRDSFLLFALAKELESAGNDGQSLVYYLRLKEYDPAYVGLYYHLGKLYERQEDFQNAIQTYKQGIQISLAAGDRHAQSELQGALLNLEDPE